MDALATIGAGFAAGLGWLGSALPSAPLAASPPVTTMGVVDTHHTAAARRVAQEIGALVWAARDGADLTDILDAYLDEPEITEKTTLVSRALFAGDLREVSEPSAFISALRLKTRPYSDKVERAVREGVRIAGAAGGLFSRGADARTAQKQARVVSDYDMPLPMFRAMLGANRSLVCLVALVDLAISDHRAPRRWLLEGVLQNWIDGGISLLHLAILLHGEDGVPRDLVRQERRIDWDAMRREHNDQEAIFEQMMASPGTPH